MTILKVQVNIPRDNNLPADDAINTWHFLSTGSATPAAAASAAATQITTFYAAIDGEYAQYCQTPMSYKVYDLQTVEPRVPILAGTSAFNTGSGDAFPAEVAACLSYKAAGLSGANPARRRGRIFIGPLDLAAGVYSTPDMVVTSAFRTTVTGAAMAMITAGLTADARWVVFSPTLAGPPPWDESQLEAASADVVGGWMDNAFDTVRSRGSLATARTTFGVVLP